MFGNIERDSHIANNGNDNSEDHNDVHFFKTANLFAYSEVRCIK